MRALTLALAALRFRVAATWGTKTASRPPHPRLPARCRSGDRGYPATVPPEPRAPPMPASETAPGLPVACEDLAGLLLFGPFVLASVTLLSKGQTSCCQPLRTIAYRATAYFAYRALGWRWSSQESAHYLARIHRALVLPVLPACRPGSAGADPWTVTRKTGLPVQICLVHAGHQTTPIGTNVLGLSRHRADFHSTIIYCGSAIDCRRS